IEREDFCTRLEDDLREPASTAASFEDALAFHSRGPASGCIKPMAAQVVLHHFVDLQGRELIPLKAERRRIGFRRNEPRHRADDREACPALGAIEPAFLDFAAWRSFFCGLQAE